MARGYTSAQSERLSRSVNVIAQMAKAKGIDPSSMTLGDAEKYVLERYNASRRQKELGRVADKTDLKDEFGEQSVEMKANGLRPPSDSNWVKDKVSMMLFTDRIEKNREDFRATPEGAVLAKTKDEAFDKMMLQYKDGTPESKLPYSEKRKMSDATEAADKALNAAQRRWEEANGR